MNYRKIATAFVLLSLLGCSSVEKKVEPQKQNEAGIHFGQDLYENKNFSNIIEGQKVVEVDNANGTQFMKIYDPLEPINRRMYYFNYYLDKYLLIPAVNTYDYVTPNIIQKGVKNFFANLQQINTFVNSLLQFEGRKATISLARFGINSTLGILGIFDVATALELPKPYEDFGLTFAKYGVGNGPYLVLPAFGPTNLRDGVGKGVGALLVSEVNPYEDPVGVSVNKLELRAVDAVNERKKMSNFRYYGTGSPFEYEYVRFFYTEYRDALIKKGRGE
nr:VacJ family lipoprotein [uncultured Cetobacterium sp.]